jgi:hypothetical protein
VERAVDVRVRGDADRLIPVSLEDLRQRHEAVVEDVVSLAVQADGPGVERGQHRSDGRPGPAGLRRDVRELHATAGEQVDLGREVPDRAVVAAEGIGAKRVDDDEDDVGPPGDVPKAEA